MHYAMGRYAARTKLGFVNPNQALRHGLVGAGIGGVAGAIGGGEDHRLAGGLAGAVTGGSLGALHGENTGQVSAAEALRYKLEPLPRGMDQILAGHPERMAEVTEEMGKHQGTLDSHVDRLAQLKRIMAKNEEILAKLDATATPRDPNLN